MVLIIEIVKLKKNWNQINNIYSFNRNILKSDFLHIFKIKTHYDRELQRFQQSSHWYVSHFFLNLLTRYIYCYCLTSVLSTHRAETLTRSPFSAQRKEFYFEIVLWWSHSRKLSIWNKELELVQTCESQTR